MKILFLFLFGMAVWHFVYEGIVAPTLRMHLRNRLFSLRDELRRINPNTLSGDDRIAYWFVHNGINNFLNRLPNITIHALKKLERQYQSDAEGMAAINDHLKRVTEASNKDIVDIFGKTNRVIGEAMLVNAGATFIYVIPLAIVVMFARSIQVCVSRLIIAPPRDIERVMPPSRRVKEA